MAVLRGGREEGGPFTARPRVSISSEETRSWSWVLQGVVYGLSGGHKVGLATGCWDMETLRGGVQVCQGANLPPHASQTMRQCTQLTPSSTSHHPGYT